VCLPTNTAAILREVTGIATMPGSLAERAEALLAQLRRVVPFDAGEIALLPPHQDTHLALARSGYDERTRGYLDGPSFLEDIELGGMRHSRRPVRLRDLPVPASEMFGWAEYLGPAGFRDGIGVGLFTANGRHLGLLGLNIGSADQISEAARDLVGLLVAPIAAAVDPWRALATIAGLVHGAAAGVVLAPSGAVRPLPGLPGHLLLAAGSGVLAAAAVQRAGDGPHLSFLAPLPNAKGREGAGAPTYVRVTVLTAPADLRPFAAAVVLVSPAGDLHGLGRRELQVLGWLVTGASNQRIAAALGITRRTVEAHVDHVRAKLGAPSRTAVAAGALRRGLFVPSSLDARA
jgi:DNA-binding CsgD family transcriptional regulator